MPVKPYARFAACALTLGMLSACATAPSITAQTESSQYRVRAARNYTPPGPASDPWGPYISEASRKYDVPERWIREVMRQESGGKLYGRNGDLVTSGAGAMGLMQVMPGTYDELRGRYSELGNDPYDPHNNIMAGTAYLREMYDIYGSPGFLAAYNAGPGRLDDYLTRNRVLPEETRRYVASIGPRISGSEPSRPSPGAQYAMNNLPAAVPSGTRYAAGSRYSAPAASSAPAPFITLNPVQIAPVAVARAPEPLPAVQVARLPDPTPAVQVAQLSEPARGPFITLSPQPAYVADPEPTQVAQLPEPMRAPAFQPAPVRGLSQFAQMPQPPAPVPMPAPAPVALASVVPLPVPPMPQQRTQTQMAAAALVPVGPRGIPFGLVSPANAEPIGLRRSAFAPAAGGSWGVQVGAFANEGLAASANAAARDHARDLLGGARPSVTPVRQPGGTLFRARLNGLSREAASQACERLARARTTCMMVSPDAQS